MQDNSPRVLLRFDNYDQKCRLVGARPTTVPECGQPNLRVKLEIEDWDSMGDAYWRPATEQEDEDILWEEHLAEELYNILESDE